MLFCTFVRFALDWFCLFPLPLGVLEGLRLVIVALGGLFYYLVLLQVDNEDSDHLIYAKKEQILSF